MTGRATPERLERSERSLHIVGVPGGAAGLLDQAAALGVRLEARPGGRLWADRPDLLPTALRDSLAAQRPAVLAQLSERLAKVGGPLAARAGFVPTLAGVPLDWCEGVALLAIRTAPPTILPRRWAVLAATSARLLQDHGAALHGARWDALDVFGLDTTAPATNPPGWGLAWLLGEHGEVLDVAPDVIGMRWKPDGARLGFYRRQRPAGVVLAWLLTDHLQ